MTFTAQLGTTLSMPGNIALGQLATAVVPGGTVGSMVTLRDDVGAIPEVLP